MDTLDCTDIKAMLSSLIDGEADDTTRHAAERHLAECAACRSLIDDAESLDAMIAADVDSAATGPLPRGFENTVLRMTIDRDRSRRHVAGWTTWLGWVAAAAALALAITVWALDRRDARRILVPTPEYATNIRAQQPDAPRLPTDVPEMYYAQDDPPQSWTFVGDPSAFSTPVVAARSAAVEPPSSLLRSSVLMTPPTSVTTVDTFVRPVLALPLEHSDTLSAAALLMERLAQSDLTSFADVEQIRQIADYDDLLRRLADARLNLSPAQRDVVLVVEAMLTRIVLGPVSMDDLHLMRDRAQTMDLVGRLNVMSNERPRRSTDEA